MAHMIMENDKMMSVREKPWHGLGDVLPEYAEVNDLRHKYLNWSVRKENVFLSNGEIIPDSYAIVREDTQEALGVVGERYTPLQNSDFWDFIQDFSNESKTKVETCGSLQNGRQVWALLKMNEVVEYVSGDSIEKYFMLFNSFDGSKAIMSLFTDVRVVCNNTLSIALNSAVNCYSLRHTDNAKPKLNEIQKALAFRFKYDNEINQRFIALTKIGMSDKQQFDFLNNTLFPKEEKPENILLLPVKANGKKENTKGETIRQDKINTIMLLADKGNGVDIPGVRGSAYGLFNAITEYADHVSILRNSSKSNLAEQRFKNVLFGQGHALRQTAMHELLKLAA